MIQRWLILFGLTLCVWRVPAASFEQALEDYRSGNFRQAADRFRQVITETPSSGALYNLGNSEWQLGRVGPAVLAWEQALWIDPFHRAAANNLLYARKISQLEAPQLAWYEVISTWLPVHWWAWIAGISFWGAISMMLLPGILRWPKAAWHQGLAALGLMIFLLSLPAHLGVQARARIGFVMSKDTVLRLTPTAEAQVLTRLAPGEPARIVRTRGVYSLVETARAQGWVELAALGFTTRIAPAPAPAPMAP